jgi:hypothetical protein
MNDYYQEHIFCYDIKQRGSDTSTIRRSVRTTSNCFIKITYVAGYAHRTVSNPAHLHDTTHGTIICSPLQKFYVVNNDTYPTWVTAHDLTTGEHLSTRSRKQILVTRLQLFDEPIELYSLRVKTYHNFFITHDEILTHNFLL